MSASTSLQITLSPIESGKSILARWFVVLMLFFILPLAFGYSYVLEIFKMQGAMIFAASFGVFFYALLQNYLLVASLAREFDYLKTKRLSVNLESDFNNERSIFAAHVQKIRAMWVRSGNGEVRQDNLIEILLTKLRSKNYLVSLFSSLLITFGLIGTVVGLVGTVGGIGQMIDGQGNSGALMEGIKSSMQGMGTAFYTTLVGAMLGGVTLRILHAFADNKITVFVSELAEVMEIRVLPRTRKQE